MVEAKQLLHMHGMPFGWILWTSFALAIIGTGQHNWIMWGQYTEGIFIRQDTLWTPAQLPTPPVAPVGTEPWIEAVRAFMIIGLVFTNLGAFGLNIMVACYKRFGKFLKYASYCSCAGAWSLLIAMSVYTGTVNNGYSGVGNTTPDPTTYGPGFILVWTAACCGLVGSTIFWMVLGKLDLDAIDDITCLPPK